MTKVTGSQILVVTCDKPILGSAPIAIFRKISSSIVDSHHDYILEQYHFQELYLVNAERKIFCIEVKTAHKTGDKQSLLNLDIGGNQVQISIRNAIICL